MSQEVLQRNTVQKVISHIYTYNCCAHFRSSSKDALIRRFVVPLTLIYRDNYLLFFVVLVLTGEHGSRKQRTAKISPRH